MSQSGFRDADWFLNDIAGTTSERQIVTGGNAPVPGGSGENVYYFRLRSKSSNAIPTIRTCVTASSGVLHQMCTDVTKWIQ